MRLAGLGVTKDVVGGVELARRQCGSEWIGVPDLSAAAARNSQSADLNETSVRWG
ncbi:hypothetical protein BOO71_0006850 [Deinococcus marmoris]|uniref:Uncharacterized protein n=1 Tax=Deinococcus marmoris TaxID=249408 RepID=A0A1U7NYD1_9DEIO|nr:hypothetical protein BOO71_0006850 [Deinococcus marmoris]